LLFQFVQDKTTHGQDGEEGQTPRGSKPRLASSTRPKNHAAMVQMTEIVISCPIFIISIHRITEILTFFSPIVTVMPLMHRVIHNSVGNFVYFWQKMAMASAAKRAVPSPPARSIFSRKRSSAAYIWPRPAKISLLQG